MALLDALVINAFRTDRQGRRVFVRSRRRGYLVTEQQAAAYARSARWYFALMFVAVPLSAMVFRSVTAIAATSLLWLAGWFVKLRHFTRTLEPAPEIPTMSRDEAIARATAAMGTRTISVVGLVAVTMTLVGGWLIATGTRNIGIFLLTAYAGVVAVLYFVRWRQQKRREAAS